MLACSNKERKLCKLLYILTSVWVLLTPNAGPNLHFQHFCAKVFTSNNPKMTQSYSVLQLFRIKHSTSILVQALQTVCLLNFAANIFYAFFLLFIKKCSKLRFEPVFGVRSTLTLVEIYYSKPYKCFSLSVENTRKSFCGKNKTKNTSQVAQYFILLAKCIYSRVHFEFLAYLRCKNGVTGK